MTKFVNSMSLICDICKLLTKHFISLTSNIQIVNYNFFFTKNIQLNENFLCCCFRRVVSDRDTKSLLLSSSSSNVKVTHIREDKLKTDPLTLGTFIHKESYGLRKR